MLQTFKTRLAHKEKLDGSVYLFRFLCEDPDVIQFEAGQYMLLQVPQSDGTTRNKHYSIASPATETQTFELLVKILPQGVGSDYLSSLQLGDQAIFQGPAGVFTLQEKDSHIGRDKVFIAAGTGIAPTRSIILTHIAKHPQERLILLWGIPARKDTYFVEELKKLKEKYSNFNFIIFFSRETTLDETEKEHFMLGRVNKGIDELHTKFGPPTGGSYADLDIYISGDRDIVESLRKYMIDLGADPLHLVMEKFV